MSNGVCGRLCLFNVVAYPFCILTARSSARTALNKLEKVALRYSARHGRPLVLIFNNVHFFRNDAAGKEMLLQLQQHAEAWAASGEYLCLDCALFVEGSGA